jgi:hypothetical protein
LVLDGAAEDVGNEPKKVAVVDCEPAPARAVHAKKAIRIAAALDCHTHTGDHAMLE